MANHLSALKRARQTEKRSATLRELREALGKGDKTVADKSYRETVSALDKAIQKGVIHKNTAARYKSRLAKRVRAVGAK